MTVTERIAASLLGLALILATQGIAAASAFATPCAPPPPAVRDLALVRYYTDRAGSQIDRAKLKSNQISVGKLKSFLDHVTRDADRAMRSASPHGRAQAARCATAWLAAWARDGALLGAMTGRQSEYQRKWDLAGAALAYIKVQPFATPDEHRAIAGWLRALSTKVVAFFDNPGRKRNNHWYWTGLAVGATAIATRDDARWAQARGIMKDAAADIAPDGSLPLELARQSRALHYHVFGLTPLVTLASLARARGEDWFALGDGALDRLVRFTVAGLNDPSLIEPLAGSEQDIRTGTPGYGWLYLYQRNRPAIVGLAAGRVRTRHRWLGGDVRLLAKALEAVRAPHLSGPTASDERP